MICPCGRKIVRNQWVVETDAQFQKRLDEGRCRAKCRRLYPPPKPDRPPSTLSLLHPPNYQVEDKDPNWKEKTPRSPKYLAFIREQPCILQGQFCQCTGDVVPHHTDGGGMSLKGSDLSCVPLCCSHHLLMDNAGKKGRGIWTPSQLKTIINQLHEQFNQQQKYNRGNNERD